MRSLVVDGTFNVRASGAGPDGKTWLFRSAALDDISVLGQQTLIGLGIGVVIDLRDIAERSIAPAHDLPVIHLPIYQLTDGPPLVGSLDSVYRFILDERGDQIAAAVIAIARSDSPVVVHCAVGKDRTGLVVALALLAAGRTREEVVDDYAVSGAGVALHHRQIVESALIPLQLTAAEYSDALSLHLDSPASALQQALAYLDEELGGVQCYLLRHGATIHDGELLHSRIGGIR